MFALRLLAEGGEGPNTELLWLLMVLLGFIALAVIVGWLAASRKPHSVSAKEEAVSSSDAKRFADDLVKIEGIGPKTAKVLARAGILTFADLANAKKEDVQTVLNRAGLHMMNPEGWIDQARLAAKGDWDGFEKLQRRLTGGRKKK
ncbi:MAG: hypothetical protein HXY38_13720 [Chloroflexi bacterium]|nr:hypothetical protein [Chloroflexota bacterium]